MGIAIQIPHLSHWPRQRVGQRHPGAREITVRTTDIPGRLTAR